MNKRLYKIEIINPNFETAYKSLKEVCEKGDENSISDNEQGVSSVKKDEIDDKSKRIELFNEYRFHPLINKVSYSQFTDGYFKEAIQNAFVEVINQVKQKSNNPSKNNNGNVTDLDGDTLMNRVFGCDSDQVPIISFNELSNSLDKTEQRGFLNLYKGIVGLRDRKAHLNFIQEDPLKTIEYLTLASLLIRLLDEGTIQLPQNN